MPNLRDIKKRITSVESTKQITRTMEMVATAKIRRATDRIIAATPYAKAIVEVLQIIAEKAGDTDNALLNKHDEVKTVALVVIVSDKGLAGGFNANVLREAGRMIDQAESSGQQVKIITAGRRAIPYFNYRGREIALSFKEHSDDPLEAEAREAASFVINGYVAGEIDQVHIIYNHAKNVADQVLTVEQILPVERIETHEYNEGELDLTHADEATKAAALLAAKATQADAKSAQSVTSGADKLYGDFDFEPSAEAVLHALLPQYIETSIFHAMLDSAAGEQGARRKAMKSATDNASEMVTALSRVYNRARQGAITTEITEIVGGAAALEENAA